MLVQEQLCLAEILEQEESRALWPAAKGSAALKALLTRAKQGVNPGRRSVARLKSLLYHAGRAQTRCFRAQAAHRASAELALGWIF